MKTERPIDKLVKDNYWLIQEASEELGQPYWTVYNYFRNPKKDSKKLILATLIKLEYIDEGQYTWKTLYKEITD